MFGKLFGRNKKTNPPKKKTPRDLFEELFPLIIENKQIITEKLLDIQRQMFGEEGLEKLLQILEYILINPINPPSRGLSSK